MKENIQSYNRNNKKLKIGKANLLNKGKDLTIVTISYSTIELIKCYDFLKKNKIDFDHLDLLSIKPLDINGIIKSVKKTGKLIILDNSSHEICSIGSEILSKIIQKNKSIFKSEPKLLFLPDVHQPTSFYLTKNFLYLKKLYFHQFLSWLVRNLILMKLKKINFMILLMTRKFLKFKSIEKYFF